jgi:EAL domain-containing protein (putative c-di-GMP-specific phosphodiesterase class I)
MAKDLQLQVVAEGVETKEHVDFLKNSKCDIAQGFYFAKPMPVDDFNKLSF